ncbi:MAG: FAD/NAD(P)-binding protein, partial [Actinomycetota bacterium]
MPSSALPPEVDVCVLGAGPHGLATALHLMAADPGLGERMAVIDPSGSWLATWREQFARLEIDNLRSPIVHHPAPEVSALARHVAARDLPRSGLPYELPTTAAFDDFCDQL